MKENAKVFVVMGVSSCGKTTLGQALARELSIPFFDGDDFHPAENIKKMSSGIPLEDEDREGWLGRLNALAREHKAYGAVIACSALKEIYREWLREGLEDQMVFVVMLGTYEALATRIANRSNHFMPPALLKSQFETLEIPAYGIHVDCSRPTAELIVQIKQELSGPE